MSVSCSRCGREASAATIVRCQTADCPLRRVPQRLPAGQFALMLVGIGLALAAITAAIAWLLVPARGQAIAPDPSAELAVQDVWPKQRDVATAPGTSDAGWAIEAPQAIEQSWSDVLLGRKPPESPSAPAADDDGPDWNASERVVSFACTGTLSASRRAICTSWPLATADYNLSLIYREALNAASDTRALRHAQQRWLGQLDAAEGDTKAIIALYDARGSEIAARATPSW